MGAEQNFLKKLNINVVLVVNNFNKIIDAEVNFVYIASSNGLHYEQAKFFLKNKVDLLLEKSARFLSTEIIELKNIANQNNVIQMEAIKNIHLEEFEIFKTFF